MKRHAPFLITTVFLLTIAGIVLLACSRFQGHHAQIHDRITTATNLQLDILAPFIQSKGLSDIRPSEASKTDFRGFLKDQVATGKLSDSDVQHLLEKIEIPNQDLPVYTRRGWEMPLIAEGFQNP